MVMHGGLFVVDPSVVTTISQKGGAKNPIMKMHVFLPIPLFVEAKECLDSPFFS